MGFLKQNSGFANSNLPILFTFWALLISHSFLVTRNVIFKASFICQPLYTVPISDGSHFQVILLNHKVALVSIDFASACGALTTFNILF
jgi:hypothetical protein